MEGCFKDSPMMEQWRSCKERAKGALLFFRLGDFYEAFYEDAICISKELELTLTQRQAAPMCGVPFHSVEGYLDRLIAKGYKVAIAEQLQDPKVTKGLVKRDIVRIVTPGTVIGSNLLSEKTNNFFVSVAQIGEIFGICIVDMTTGELKVVEVESKKELLDELCRLSPKEILLSKRFNLEHEHFLNELSNFFPFTLDVKEDWYFDYKNAYECLTAHFKVFSLDGFGLQGWSSAIVAAGALLIYLRDDLNLKIAHLQKLEKENISNYMSLDFTTFRNLELLEAFSTSNKKNTLCSLLDKTKTPMGGRLLQFWIKHPLLDVIQIKKREDSIEEFLNKREELKKVVALLDQIYDLDRLTIKIVSGFCSPKDVVALRFSLEKVFDLKAVLKSFQSDLLIKATSFLHDFSTLCDKLRRAIIVPPPYRLGEGDTFCFGYSFELDEIRKIKNDSKQWLAEFQNKLREETQIKTLKVGFTRAFGYYIEVSKGQSSKVSPTFVRKQTLVNAERFITQELKEFELKVLSAEERINGIEIELFEELKREISSFKHLIEESSKSVAIIDVLAALAIVAEEKNYKRPIVDESKILDIKKGRHPIIECAAAMSFTPNDCFLDGDNDQLMLITGPNMAGKSTYIRQVALIIIMAQIGSFVPAEYARIGVIDKLFSRIGASDDLSRGQSTFMVEMSETANILNNITARSLVILDEIGRGTSTYDGISIAWAVAEYILTTENKSAKTLFATHFWELTALEGLIKGAKNYHVTVQEGEVGIVFLHKIAIGSTDKSYGIHVARLAGLPGKVLVRAKELLIHLEKGRKDKKVKIEKSKKIEEQLFFFDL